MFIGICILCITLLCGIFLFLAHNSQIFWMKELQKDMKRYSEGLWQPCPELMLFYNLEQINAKNSKTSKKKKDDSSSKPKGQRK